MKLEKIRVELGDGVKHTVNLGLVDGRFVTVSVDERVLVPVVDVVKDYVSAGLLSVVEEDGFDVEETSEEPSMDWLKKDIQEYMRVKDISYNKSDTKKELLKKIDEG